MRFIACFILVVGLLTSCTNVKKSEKPDNFYDQEKMVRITTDMYLLEGVMSTNRRSFLKTAVRPDSFLFKKYRTDSLTYAQNFNYYIDRIDEYEVILEKVSERLISIQKGMNKEELEQSLNKNLILKEDSIVLDTVNKKQLRVPKSGTPFRMQKD
jgi:hypothetical protein